MPVTCFSISCSSYRQASTPWPVDVRRQRVAPEEARQHRERIAGPRVVLHRARTERVEVRVDGEIELRKPRVVTHRLQLRDLGQRRRRRRRNAAGTSASAPTRRELRRRAAAGTRQLEDQGFGSWACLHLCGRGPAQHARQRARVSLDVRVVRVSVAQTRSASPKLREIAREVEPADDAVGRERLEHRAGGAVEPQHGLVETRAREGRAHARQLRERGARVQPCVRGRRAPRARGRPDPAARGGSSPRSSAGPGWCRCSTSPSRAGCAVRAPAASA